MSPRGAFCVPSPPEIGTYWRHSSRGDGNRSVKGLLSSLPPQIIVLRSSDTICRQLVDEFSTALAEALKHSI